MTTTGSRQMRKILGLGFGLAFAFGSTVGAGFLRLPSSVATVLGDRTLILTVSLAGGVYALMGAVTIAELATMIPHAGGFRVYARRAFGEGVGFAIGCVDWLCSVAVVAYVSVTAVEFVGSLWHPVMSVPRLAAIALVCLFTGIHWTGLRVASSLTIAISVAIGVTMMIVVMGCFFAVPVPPAPGLPHSAASLPPMSIAMFLAVIAALRTVLAAYDGWYSPIYMVEENATPDRTLPRAIVGGAGLVVAVYLLINAALLRVLPIPVLASSMLPVADAARLVMPRGGATLVTLISLLMMLSVLGSCLLMAPRVLFAIGRDGLLMAQTANVSSGGTPRMALAISSAVAMVLILTGTFEQLIALYAVLFLVLYVSAFLAIFVLRYREPDLRRPYVALGYPISSAIVLLGSIAILAAAVIEDPRSGMIAALFLAGCVPAYGCAARARRRRSPGAPA